MAVRKSDSKPFPWKCSQCRQRSVVPSTAPYTAKMEHDGRTYVVSVADLEAPRCQVCGETILDDAANRRISDTFRQQLGLLTPKQIRRNREALDMTQRQLAGLLGIAEATLSRWETGGQIQQRSLDRLLRLFFAFPELRSALVVEPTLGGLGSSVPMASGESETAPPQELMQFWRSGPMPSAESETPPAHELRDAFRTAFQEAMSSVRTSLRRRLRGSIARRWEEREPEIAESLLAALMWCFHADRSSLQQFRSCFERRISPRVSGRLRLAAEGRWLVVPLKAERKDDTERATRLSQLAAALDELPEEKEAAAVDEFHRLVRLLLATPKRSKRK